MANAHLGIWNAVMPIGDMNAYLYVCKMKDATGCNYHDYKKYKRFVAKFNCSSLD